MSAFKRNLVPLVCIAFVAASVATAIFYGLLGSRLREASADTPRQSIVVTARALERGATLTAADVRLSTWGGQYSIKGGYAAIEQVTGKRLASAVQENEPVTQALFGAIDGSGGIGIAPGMRAISVHASDSSGVVALLRPGHKVDVQVVAGDRGGNVKLRTALENVEVLSVSPPDANGGRSAAPVVTLLAKPEDADYLGLADSGARIRVLLRNPLDEGRGSRHGLDLASIFANWDAPRLVTGSPRQASVRAPSSAVKPAAAELYRGPNRRRVRLRVVAAGAKSTALAQLAARTTLRRPEEVLQAATLRAGPATAQLLSALEDSREIEVFSSTELSAANGRPAGIEVGGVRAGLRIRFLPRLGLHGSLRLRVQTELTGARSAGMRPRRMHTEVDLLDGQSMLVMGLVAAADWPVLAERLFANPAASSANRELVVIVTAQMAELTHTALAGSR